MKFTQWDIPFALIPLKSYEVETRINWRAAALKAFQSIPKFSLLKPIVLSVVPKVKGGYSYQSLLEKTRSQTICLHSNFSTI